MMRERRGDHRCKRCSWFGHMTYQCQKREIVEKRRRKSESGGNRFVPLQSKVNRRMEGGVRFSRFGQYKATALTQGGDVKRTQ